MYWVKSRVGSNVPQVVHDIKAYKFHWLTWHNHFKEFAQGLKLINLDCSDIIDKNEHVKKVVINRLF